MNDLKEQYEAETGKDFTYKKHEAGASICMASVDYIEWLEAKLQTPQPEGVKPDVSAEDMEFEEIPYCTECGGMDLAYLDQYANGSEYRCRECNHTFIQ